MGIISYQPLMDDMTWSYSRIQSFHDCPYRFFLKYIKGRKDSDKFYASYGRFLHKILERYYLGELTQPEMLLTFLTDFQKEVRGVRPGGATVQKYITAGSDYLRSFSPLPFQMIDVEKQVAFYIENRPFIGFIDYLGYDDDGSICIVDHKSRDLKPRSGRKTPTRADLELDEMLRQLYLYAAAVEQEYHALPQFLCFNCLKSGVFIQEKFDMQKYLEAQQWAIESIEEISDAEDFAPRRDFFSCCYLCGVSDHCRYDMEARKERRRT